jgi:hypothetical protein
VGLIDAEHLLELLDLEDEFGLFPRHVPVEQQTKAQSQPAAAAQPTPTLVEREANR